MSHEHLHVHIVSTTWCTVLSSSAVTVNLEWLWFSVFSSDYSKSSQESKIEQHINKTVFVGETVTLHCNKTTFDDDFTWKINNTIIFRMVSDNNITKTNFSSNRIHIDPAARRELTIHQIQASDAGNYSCYPAVMGWTLTVTGYYTISFIFIWTRKTVCVYN